ncbi:MAG: dipeptide epimerase [Candidatus Omnitrophica bacterium]|nr:dipeptide epimerase [Candidatus Omnitrophota bacterium]
MRNKLCVKTFTVSRLHAPLTQPFRIASGEHTSLDNLVFSIELEDGTRGWGEAGIATHITGETIDTTAKNLQIAGDGLLGMNISNYLAISSGLHEHFSSNKAALAAIEQSLLDALSRHLRIPLWWLFGQKPAKLTSDITIVIAEMAETEENARKFYEMGFRKFKIKIGRDFDLDMRRVTAVGKIAAGADIYLDANQGYTAKEMLSFLKLLDKSGIKPKLLEQPVPKDDWDGLKELTRSCDIPVCADESVANIDNCLKAIREKAVKAINIKLMKFGLIQAREAAVLAKAGGVQLMIGSMVESPLAATAAAHLAAGLGGFSYIDLDTPFFMKDYRSYSHISRTGVYDVSKVREGIGVIPLPEMLTPW